MEKKDSPKKTKETTEEDLTVGGYGYWKRDSDLVNNEKFIPKPLDKADSFKIEEPKVVAGSAWNTAGTWEEKHYTKKQIEEFFNLKLKEKSYNGFVIQSISGYSGDVSHF